MSDAIPQKITGATVRDDFNAISTVLHYTRAAHFIGLWKSELALIERYFPAKTARLLEAGCGAGRVAVGLWHQEYRNITAFDFAAELVEQAVNLAQEQGITGISFLQADATQPLLSQFEAPDLKSRISNPKSQTQDPRPKTPDPGRPALFDGALFLFNGLMQIPGRERRRAALRELHAVTAPDAPLLFTTHDRDSSLTERALWRLEALRWTKGQQDPRLVEFGDRYFDEPGTGRTFMHLPDRREILEDLAATGWRHAFDAMRPEIARENHAVRDFSDDCRFWAAHHA